MEGQLRGVSHSGEDLFEVMLGDDGALLAQFGKAIIDSAAIDQFKMAGKDSGFGRDLSASQMDELVARIAKRGD